MNNNYLYDPKTGGALLTTEQAAEYLGYNYASVRHIVSEGGLKSCAQAGKTLLFRKADLEAYIISHARGRTAEEHDIVKALPTELEAELKIDQGLGSGLAYSHKLKGFDWSDIPKIRANLKFKYRKDMAFEILIKTPDGSLWRIEHQPEGRIEKAFKRLLGKK